MRVVLVVLGFLALACGRESANQTSQSGASSGSSGSHAVSQGSSSSHPGSSSLPGASSAVTGGPVVEAYTVVGNDAGTANIEDTGTFTVTVRVSDPDGVADIAGGTLLDHATGATLSTFTGAAGVYQASISWALIRSHHDISFLEPTTPYAARAVFHDAANHEGSRVLELTLACHFEGTMACAGYCVGRSEPTHCGGCDVDCARITVGRETQYGCFNEQCFAVLDSDTPSAARCSDLCATVGQACVAGTDSTQATLWGFAVYNYTCLVPLESCTAVPADQHRCLDNAPAEPLVSQRCYCR